MELTIVSGELGSTGPQLMQPAVALAKAGLLYADRVTLVSRGAYLPAMVARGLLAADKGERLNAAVSVLAGVDAGTDSYARLASEQHRTDEEQAEFEAQRDRLLEATASVFDRGLEYTLELVGAQELAEPVMADLVRLEPLLVDEPLFDLDVGVLAHRLSAYIEQVVDSKTTTHPLFDDRARGILASLVTAGAVERDHLTLTNRAALANELVSGLEAFPLASMDVVLDVRGRIRQSLVRFRAAIAEASAELSATAADPTFYRAVEDIRVRLVEPALLEIRESLEDLGALPTLGRGFPTAAGGFLGMVAGLAVDLGDLASASAGLGAAGAAVVREGEYRRQSQLERRTNRFFFLYETNVELARAIQVPGY